MIDEHKTDEIILVMNNTREIYDDLCRVLKKHPDITYISAIKRIGIYYNYVPYAKYTYHCRQLNYKRLNEYIKDFYNNNVKECIYYE